VPSGYSLLLAAGCSSAFPPEQLPRCLGRVLVHWSAPVLAPHRAGGSSGTRPISFQADKLRILLQSQLTSPRRPFKEAHTASGGTVTRGPHHSLHGPTRGEGFYHRCQKSRKPLLVAIFVNGRARATPGSQSSGILMIGTMISAISRMEFIARSEGDHVT
jgi:hypothetical protein